MSEREDHEFYADSRVRGGLARRCKQCSKIKVKRAQRQDIKGVEVTSAVPSDYRISGFAFQVAGTFARNVDGDWFRIVGNRLTALYADNVSRGVLARAPSEIERILRSHA